MKTEISLMAIAIGTALIISCNKNDSVSTRLDTSVSEITVATSLSTATTDSVSFDHHCERGEIRDSIAVTELPGSILSYLDSNYAGHTLYKAFKERHSSGSIRRYIVVIYLDDKPIGFRFDADGTFDKVLEKHRARNDHGHENEDESEDD